MLHKMGSDHLNHKLDQCWPGKAVQAVLGKPFSYQSLQRPWAGHLLWPSVSLEPEPLQERLGPEADAQDRPEA